jgi:hypothetical protein
VCWIRVVEKETYTILISTGKDALRSRGDFAIHELDILGVFSQRRVGAFIILIGIHLTDVLSEDSTSFVLFNRHNFMDAVDNLRVFS